MSKTLLISCRRSNTRSPKWTEEHNNVFGKILMGQFLLGNIPNGIPKKDIWETMTTSLNRRLNIAYSVSVVLTRFKNMKCDFRIIYQLSNKSGWGWDEENHLPTASDEIWDEVIQENPSLARFRRNPFHQYDIFSKMCGENIATGNLVRSTRHANTPVVSTPDDTMGEENRSHHSDTFLDIHDISFKMNNMDGPPEPDVHGLQHDFPAEKPVYYKQDTSSGVNSRNENDGNTTKRTSINGSSRRPRKGKICKEEIQMLVQATNERTRMFERESRQQMPFTMSDCMSKLDSVPQLSNKGMLSVLASLNNNTQNIVIFMSLAGDRLQAWIEDVHTSNPRYRSYPAWSPENDIN